MTDFRLLLKKYVLHVASHEGDAFAQDLDMAIYRMGENEYSEEEKLELKKLFSETSMEKWGSK